MKNSMKLYSKVTGALSGIMKFLFRVEYIGAENEKDIEKTIVCANHMSNWDPVIMACIMKSNVNFMAKAELFKFKPLGKVLSMLGAFPINRGVGDLGAIRLTLGLLKDGNNICMFPQGKRYVGIEPEISQVKSGIGMMINHSKADVLPVGLYTKGNKIRLFKKVYIVVGEKMSYDSLGFVENTKEEYQLVSEKIFERITELSKSVEKKQYDK